MNIPTEFNNVVSMTTLEIAELTGKLHKNVLRDSEKLLEVNRLKNELVAISYSDVKGEPRKAYQLTKKATFVLVSGYSVELRLKCFERIEFLESQVKHLKDTLKRAAIQSANRRGVTWGDYCKTHGLPAQKLMTILKKERKLFSVNPISGEWSVNPAFAEYFRVIKPKDQRFSPDGINIRFNSKGLGFFSQPENVLKMHGKLIAISGTDTDKQRHLQAVTKLGGSNHE